MIINFTFVNNSIVCNQQQLCQIKKNNNQKELDCKIESIIKKYIINIKNVDEIKITLSSIKYGNNKNWHKIKLSKEEQKTVQRILQKSPILVLKHDRIGEMVAEMIKKQDIPTLYLYSSGGGGHKSAKDAKLEANLTAALTSIRSNLTSVDPLMQDPCLQTPSEFINYCKKMGFVHEVDVLNDYLGQIGKWSSRQWDEAQIAGDVKQQERLASKQWLSDIIFGPIVFFETLKSLIAYHPTTIVSTQAMATPAILLAIRIYNSFYKPSFAKDVKLHLYMTDMPTKYSGHFFNSLKKLKDMCGKNYLILHAPKPKNKTDWKILCGLGNNQVEELTTNELPVRPAFIQAAEKYIPSSKPQVQIKVSGNQELELLRKLLQHQDSNYDTSKLGNSTLSTAQSLNYSMKPKDEGYFLMLGSQPTKQAIKDYIAQFILLAKQNSDKNFHLFAFAGKFEADKACFYKELSKEIQEIDPWPSNLRVLPLSFQDPSQLISLELQCHTITRSGGATIMELLVLEEVVKKLKLPAKQRFIHAQKVEGRSLEDSIPLWEKGNYFFLRDELFNNRVNAISPRQLGERLRKNS